MNSNRSEDDEEFSESDSHELQMVVKQMSAKFDDLVTCANIAGKQVSTLDSELGRLEHARNTEAIAESLKSLKDSTALLHIGAGATINVSSLSSMFWKKTSMANI